MPSRRQLSSTGRRQDCRAEITDETLVLETGAVRRTYEAAGGRLAPRTLENLETGTVLALGGGDSVRFPGVSPAPESFVFETREVPPTARAAGHLEATVTTRHGALELRRRFRLFPGAPAIVCDLFFRGGAAVLEAGGSVPSAADLRNVETLAASRDGRAEMPVCERLALPGNHWHVTAVRFRDVTDRENNLVSEEHILPYRAERLLAGNVLFCEPVLESGAGIFLLKEAPCSDVQLHYPGADFAARIGEIRVLGAGIGPDDLEPGEWVRGYSVVVGMTDGTSEGRRTALRRYRLGLRPSEADGAAGMLMMNTWGDRGQDSRLCEAFALAELEAGARLGITHFQLDDGWQYGRSSNSAFAGGSLAGIWDNPDYWTPHPERFPRGLGPVVDRGAELGIEVCLWFNPSADDSYAHWRDDAEALVRLHREYGVRTFKIDGVRMPDKRAEINLRRLFDSVVERSAGQAVFNLDVTAGRRYGYHYFHEYGNVFLENRYTDWGNYYPHWTLRNLWMLAAYVPPADLQVEFLNRWRNPDKYPQGDPLAPSRIPFEYCFAVAMTAQPLAWFEGSGLPEEAFAIAPAVAVWREHAGRFRETVVLPVGEEPCGTAWTGFLCRGDGWGYLQVFRELNRRDEATFHGLFPPGSRVRFRRLCGQGSGFEAVAGERGEMTFSLPEAFTYALYEYEEFGG